MPYRLWKFRILAELSCRIWWNGFVLPPRVQHSILNDLHRRQVKHSLSLLQQSYAIGKFVEAATEAFLNADDLGSIAEDHPTRLRTQESRRFDNRYWGPMALAAFLGLVLSISGVVVMHLLQRRELGAILTCLGSVLSATGLTFLARSEQLIDDSADRHE